MTALSNIQAEVERRVNEGIVPAIFDRLVRVHGKYEYRTCNCDFCQLKRISTERIANAKHRLRPTVKKMMKMHMEHELREPFTEVKNWHYL